MPSNLKTIACSSFTDNSPLQMGTSFEHRFNYDLLMAHVFKVNINQSYFKLVLHFPKATTRLGLVAYGLKYFGFSSQPMSLVQSKEFYRQ